MEATIILPTEDLGTSAQLKKALQALATNLTTDNLVYLGKLSEKQDINKKLDSKKGLINTFL